ncbi:hypothetical protein BHF71_01710 [Vulcanibacillus modesticaldus]|uniref:DUF302 domain-containing protein n=1 Tax=Vulcanibacillus modesticaldus TaxID=337097 RepID=A0A1D2YUE8_9BACI|nr:DUF302 domain-containing protein [Vulcanibacillus modesticaldus]OEF99332.1 hypothetical protein BHF71_01710 [Vulcanibacillus modesticaldus]
MEYHYTVSTRKSAEQVIKDLEENLKEIKFGVLWNFEIHKKLQEKGIVFDKKITVLEVCNPFEASKILEIEPMVSYFLPCKIVVNEEDAGTKVGMVKPTLMIKMIGNEELTEIAKEIEDKLVSAINKAVSD